MSTTAVASIFATLSNVHGSQQILKWRNRKPHSNRFPCVIQHRSQHIPKVSIGFLMSNQIQLDLFCIIWPIFIIIIPFFVGIAKWHNLKSDWSWSPNEQNKLICSVDGGKEFQSDHDTWKTFNLPNCPYYAVPFAWITVLCFQAWYPDIPFGDWTHLFSPNKRASSFSPSSQIPLLWIRKRSNPNPGLTSANHSPRTLFFSDLATSSLSLSKQLSFSTVFFLI